MTAKLKLSCIFSKLYHNRSTGITSQTVSASAYDVTSIDKFVTFQPGQTTAIVSVDIAVDNEVEDDEVFTLALSIQDAGSLGQYPNLAVTIIDSTELEMEERNGKQTHAIDK